MQIVHAVFLAMNRTCRISGVMSILNILYTDTSGGTHARKKRNMLSYTRVRRLHQLLFLSHQFWRFPEIFESSVVWSKQHGPLAESSVIRFYWMHDSKVVRSDRFYSVGRKGSRCNTPVPYFNQRDVHDFGHDSSVKMRFIQLENVTHM